MKTQLSNIGILVLFLSAGLLTGCGGESAASHVVAPPATEPVVATVAAEAPADAPQAAGSEPTPVVEPAANEPPKPAEPAAQSDAPKPPVAKRLPADRQPRRPGDAEKITFEDLNLGMQADVAYRPFMLTDRVKELDGQRVSIIGYIHGAPLTPQAMKEFVLLKNTECKFGKGGQADHLGMVYIKEGSSARYSRDPVKIEGTLKVSPYTGPDGNTWSVYDFTDAVALPAK